MVDESKSASPVKYEEASDGLLYPHIYGPLNHDAIADIRRMEKMDGHWRIGGSIR